MLGVVGVEVLGMALSTRFGIELTEEELPVDEVSKSTVFSLAVRMGLISKSLGRETLKMESVGMFGVDSSNPP
jgi:hypothetical protein